ncbi:MAG TPA: Na+/H+ antiporter [Casimicrobiaceae bacterium]|nr:Na+/H+ antiporter [Casimicrobiaceae bacterium]
MDYSVLSLVVILCATVAALSVAAQRLRVAAPILLLVAGAAVAFVPAVPQVALDPELVLVLLLPPFLYSSGVGMSWRGFRSNLRPILLLAIGCVLFTAAAVAAVMHYALGFSWAVGFVLGAIVSPPDAVAPMALLRSMRLPRRLVTVLEGESLVNDATALVTLGLAINAVASGTFSLVGAASEFLVIVIGEVAFGIAVGWAMLRLRHVASDARAEVMLALITPFLAFWPPHALGGSGVVACVAAGLYVSWNGRRLIRPDTRLQGYFIWDLLTWAIEALVFLLTGLQARSVVVGLSGEGLHRALIAAVAVTLTVIAVRFVWVYPATYLPRLLMPKACASDPPPDWRMPFLVSFTGLRGAVSLIGALLIPAFIAGKPFPDRDVVLFATYAVIVVTIVVLGMTLGPVVRLLGLNEAGADEFAANRRDERQVRLEALDAVLQRLDGESGAPVDALRRAYADRRARIAASEGASSNPDTAARCALELVLIGAERASIAASYEENRITDESRRRIERELDLEEARVRHTMTLTPR